MSLLSRHCPSPFLSPGSTASDNSLAILHLKRDLLLPTKLQLLDSQNEGYEEGKVTNTRFGSFPHSTLIGVPWGTQVRASAVDTGSRGRRGNSFWGTKRKRNANGGLGKDEEETEVVTEEAKKAVEEPKAAVQADTGFVHLLPPTPETWTASLPHRTQLVYTPDYSYILHRLRIRPGSVVIEAGAGSGSFTHAVARAVFNGYPSKQALDTVGNASRVNQRGKVWSFEFHRQRTEKLKAEICEHGLDGIVEVVQKDVCQDGFRVDNPQLLPMNANAIFLDLPAPWFALKHLTRAAANGNINTDQSLEVEEPEALAEEIPMSFNRHTSPSFTLPSQSILDPESAIHLCTFSPCIEQVQRTVTTLRQLGWVEIEMVEIAARRIEVRRERVGLQEEGLMGVNSFPTTVDEAVARLREIEGRSRLYHDESAQDEENGDTAILGCSPPVVSSPSKQQRLDSIKHALNTRKIYKEGRLVHRAEGELKTHTSYLVFAVLPREWTEADELQAQQKCPVKVAPAAKETPLSKKQRKKLAKAKARESRASNTQPKALVDNKSLSP